MVYAAPNAAGTGRRYVACGKVPKCGFFEWIDDEEDGKSGCKSKEKRVQCFCGDALILQMSGNACSNGGNCRSQRMDADGEK
ncbi:hypothetical protein PIB30_031077 [Stylosanthes scabra]|uniref:Zinc finger GRF-type domain-containing protein n=1 Tax=Stylosanthes scabra TaxID=79078 RepID=A0ABU6SBF5_9FABA|nr:hypothetical protein [Stylosanthes scabra]